MVALTKWICNKSAVVKIVHPGGHVEVHDGPVLAAEIMNRNPKCCVARPNVFQQPWAAILAPDTTLVPGQKFYVVPKGTVRKLQSLALKHFPSSMAREIQKPQHDNENDAQSSLSGASGNSSSSSSETKIEIAPNRLSSFDNWQPGLESISEE
nr:Beta-3 adrenergic receptor, putative [Ipomoea batatas]